jgi:hypothetical protein
MNSDRPWKLFLWHTTSTALTSGCVDPEDHETKLRFCFPTPSNAQTNHRYRYRRRGHPRKFTSLRYGYPVISKCLRYGYPVISKCLRYGYPVISKCQPYDRNTASPGLRYRASGIMRNGICQPYRQMNSCDSTTGPQGLPGCIILTGPWGIEFRNCHPP